MNTKYVRLEATGDNGYRCSCCGHNWDIVRDFNTEHELIQYCIDEIRSAEEIGDGFTIDAIKIVEIGKGFETKSDHPDESALKAKIEKLYSENKMKAKIAEEQKEKQKQLVAYAAELAGMEDRKAFLEAQLKGG